MGIPKVNSKPTPMSVTMTMYEDGIDLLANLVAATKAAGAPDVSRGKIVRLALQLLEKKPVGEIVRLLAESPPPSR